MKYSFKTRPYNHQRMALRKLLKKRRGGCLFMEMGTGKTKVAIDYACIAYMKKEIEQVLVVCPKSVIGVWDREVALHTTQDKLKWKVMNYDKVRIPHYLSQLRLDLRDHKTLLVLDEAHKVKNPGSKQSKACWILSKIAVKCLCLTGTPITKHPLDVFGQMRCVDESVFGTSYGMFKREYALWGGYGGYQLLKYINLKRLMEKLGTWVFIAKKEDCLDLPSKTHEIVPVYLRESRETYERMAKDSVVEFENGTVSDAPIVLTRLLRLSQITGGWVKRDDDNYQNVGQEKRDTFQDLIQDMDENGTEKIVVFVRFLKELLDASRVCADAGYKVLPFYGAVSSRMREQRLMEFDESDGKVVFIAQISTGSLGITLTAASTAIFYSHTYDYAEFAQACDRLHRIGQKKPVMYYHLIAQDTVDEAVWLAIRTKKRIADIVLARPELLI